MTAVGFAAAVLGAMALWGAGSASAEGTVLCDSDVTPCPLSHRYPALTVLTASLRPGTDAVVDAGGFGRIRCKESTISAETTQEVGGPGGVLRGEIRSGLMGRCWNGGIRCTFTPKRLHWRLGVLPEGGGSGGGASWVYEDPAVDGYSSALITCGIVCAYGMRSGRLRAVGGDPARVWAGRLAFFERGNKFLCPSTVTLDAIYEVTAPLPIYSLRTH